MIQIKLKITYIIFFNINQINCNIRYFFKISIKGVYKAKSNFFVRGRDNDDISHLFNCNQINYDEN